MMVFQRETDCELGIHAIPRTAETLISPLRGQLLPEGEAFGAAEAKSLLPWEKVSPQVTDEVRTGPFSHWFSIIATSCRRA
jgi:hypothetical protein